MYFFFLYFIKNVFLPKTFYLSSFSPQMYTQFVNGYDKAMSVFQDTMKENPDFANLVSQFQVGNMQTLEAFRLKIKV